MTALHGAGARDTENQTVTDFLPGLTASSLQLQGQRRKGSDKLFARRARRRLTNFVHE